MPITLPKQKSAPTRLSPATILLYGAPKVGKTKSLTELEDNLILDLEKGTEMHTSMALSASTYGEFNEILIALATEWEKEKKPLYKYLTVDTIDIMEDFSIHKAADLFRHTPMGKTWFADNYSAPGVLKPHGELITMLPKGAGWGYVREALKWYINVLKNFAEHVILVAHVKDKVIPSIDGLSEVSVKEISLAGKNGSIVAAAVDVIGYMYREKGNLMVSFETNENSTMGSRYTYLAGKKFQFDWTKIFID